MLEHSGMKGRDEVERRKAEEEKVRVEEEERKRTDAVRRIVEAERERREEQERLRIESLFRRDVVQDEINYMSGAEFEKFMTDLFRQRGYAVEETPATGDQGVDLILPDYDGKRVAVQLKRWSGPVGNAVVLYPILKRQNEILILGYVTARVMECVFIAVGILSLLTVVALRQEAAAGADAASLVTAGKTLVALHEWTRLLGPGFMVGVGNGLILGYLMYRSALVPRGMAVLGLVGGPLIIASGVGVLLGVIEEGGVVQGIATLPEFFWELLLGIWPIVRGFDPSAVARLEHESP